MTPILKWAAALLAVVSVIPVCARLAGQVGPPKADPAAAAGRDAETAEDVEIFRQILNRSCGLPRLGFGGFGGIGGNGIGGSGMSGFGGHTFSGGGISGFGGGGLGGHQGLGTGFGGGLGGFGGAPPLVETFDGVYLKGHGAVFTVKVPAQQKTASEPPAKWHGLADMCLTCHTSLPVAHIDGGALPAAAPPTTEWQRVRNELRGVKTAAPPSAPAPKLKPSEVCDPGSVAEAVVKALAANGRNFRHLPPAEAVTVVVTYEGLPAARAAKAAGPADSPGENGFTQDEMEQITIADLHLKQGNAGLAAEAYRKALARIGDGPVKLPADRLRVLQERFPMALDGIKQSVAEVRRKLAHARIAGGDLPGAKKALDAALGVTVEAGDAAAGDAPPLLVPAKLVISARKAHLDAAGRLSPAEFRKGVAIESSGLMPPAKGKK